MPPRHLIALFVVLIAFASCQKKVEVPTTVTTETMAALFLEEKVSVDQVAAYSEVWQTNFGQVVDEKITANSSLADADLVDETGKAKEVVQKLEGLATLTDGDARIKINSTIMTIKKTVDRADRYLATKQGAASAKPAEAASESAPAASKPAKKEDQWVYQVHCEDPDGYVNVRKRPTASSEIVGCLYQGGDYALSCGKSGNWIKVRMQSGTVGYCHKDHVRLEFDPSENEI